MKREIASVLILSIILSLSASGCSFFRRNFAEKAVPAGKQLIFDKARDYTYLVALDAVLEEPGWEIYFTDKTSGKITAYDIRYTEAFNPDERLVTIWVTPIERKKTAVSLDATSIRKLRAYELLDAIEKRMAKVTGQIVKAEPRQQPQIPGTA